MDTLVTLKINIEGSNRRFKLPLRDLGASTLPDKVRRGSTRHAGGSQPHGGLHNNLHRDPVTRLFNQEADLIVCS